MASSDPSPDFNTLYVEALFTDTCCVDKRNELSSGAGPLPSGLEIFPNYDLFPRPENRVNFIA